MTSDRRSLGVVLAGAAAFSRMREPLGRSPEYVRAKRRLPARLRPDTACRRRAAGPKQPATCAL